MSSLLEKIVTGNFDSIAEQLRAAYRGRPIAPLVDTLNAVDAAGAYAIQDLNTRHWVGQGRRIVGRKVGLTAKSVQQQLGVDQPDYGILFADMEVPDGGVLSPSRTLQSKAEVEVALVLERDIDDPRAAANDVARAVAYAVPALEIVDSRIADWKIRFADTVADNGSSAFFVLGREPRSLWGLDLWSCGGVLEFNGEIRSTGVGAACLGGPLHAAAWLARTLAGLGDGLKAGDVVLTGAIAPMVSLTPGDVVRGTIGGLGSVGFTFGDEQS
jgi:2-keto-4-pentenoate hydratase